MPVEGSRSSALSHRFFFWEGLPTKIDYRKKGALILTSLLEDLVVEGSSRFWGFWWRRIGLHCSGFRSCRLKEN